MTTFENFTSTVSDDERLADIYSAWLADLFNREFWSPGMDAGRRILWRRGDEARNELREAFDSPGLYLWGAREIPIYVGMTEGTFRRRFRRYIWSERSQCKLAARYEGQLIDQGIDGFPEEIREWYHRSFGSSTVRLEGAVAFARAGIEDVWFALLPAEDEDPVKDVEEALIPVAASWNREHGRPELLNVQHM